MVASPSQRFGRPARQYSHVPQKADRQPITWSPGATWRTSQPTASTTPAGSCPSTVGSGIRQRALEDVQIAVADARRDGADEHLARPRRVDLDVLDARAARRSRASRPPSWHPPVVGASSRAAATRARAGRSSASSAAPRRASVRSGSRGEHGVEDDARLEAREPRAEAEVDSRTRTPGGARAARRTSSASGSGTAADRGWPTT